MLSLAYGVLGLLWCVLVFLFACALRVMRATERSRHHDSFVPRGRRYEQWRQRWH
jgi:hypothetical protein